MTTLVTVGAVERRGRVSYIGGGGEKEYVTIECPKEQEAWRFVWTGTGIGSPITVGDWLVFSGETRVKILNRRIVEEPYYHNPHNKDVREGWTYYEVCSFTEPVRRIGSIEIDKQLCAALNRINLHFSDWPSHAYQKKLEETIGCLEETVAALLREAKLVATDPASIVEVKID